MAESSSKEDGRTRKLSKLILQLFHLVLSAAILLIGVIEFSVEPTIFDVFGKKSEQRSVIPLEVFNVTIVDKSLGHILDAPVFFLFLIYFLSVLWLKCRGVFAWLLTCNQIFSILLYLGVNAGLSRIILDWRYFSTRAVIILLDVLILSFAWTVIVVTLLHIRGWFPFKVKKYRDIPYHERTAVQKVAVIIWNFLALYMVLALCFLVWFSKLYISWACVRQIREILLMCQFTNMVQCWPCSNDNDHCDVSNITDCIHEINEEPIRCISPLYTVDPFPSAFCVFNYNIGAFTFVTVFSYVGGIYFFMRTVLNAIVKCLFSIIFIAVHFCSNLYNGIKKRQLRSRLLKSARKNSINDSSYREDEDLRTPPVTNDPRVSLLGPLPHQSTATTKEFRTTSKTKYV